MSVLTDKEKEALLKELKKEERIEKEVSLGWDGANLILRLPKEIGDYLGVTKKNRFEKSILFLIEEKEGKVIKTFDIVNRKKEIRKSKHGNRNTYK